MELSCHRSSKDRDRLTDRMSFASTYIAGRFLLLCWVGSGYRFCDFCGRREWPVDSHNCIVVENCMICTTMFYIICVGWMDLLKIEKVENTKIVKTIFCIET